MLADGHLVGVHLLCTAADMPRRNCTASCGRGQERSWAGTRLLCLGCIRLKNSYYGATGSPFSA